MSCWHYKTPESPEEESDEEFSAAVDDLMKDIHSSEESDPEDTYEKIFER